ENGAVAVRTCSREDLGAMSISAFVERLLTEQGVGAIPGEARDMIWTAPISFPWRLQYQYL
ncbi:hypothetical protein, partial [Xylella fastidiosa]|uniref:hypothetical protein n=1 Tax=Xylella fastidiosa TaxID=2371 RepID=UPI0012AE6E25